MPDIKSNRRIAKNAVFLYSRMLLIMFVALYTSRVTLKALGEEDYGIYQVVCGTVTFLSFLSNALANGMARFLTFEIGKQESRLEALFATVRTANIVLGIVVVIIGEVLGLWLIHHKIIIAPERMTAAIFAFHFSMMATFFQIVQAPYNALIIAHEYMNIYAFISVLDAGGKLLIALYLLRYTGDPLKAYAVLMFCAGTVILWGHILSCRKKINSIRYRFSFDVGLFRDVASFSGWNLFSSSAAAIANQGVTIVAGMFFEPVMITVRALAQKVNNIVFNFMNSFRTAVNPQIVKKYAAKEYEESKKLALASTQYTYYLMLLIVVPLFLLTQPALKIWLGEVPDGLVPFVQLALFQGLFQALDASLYVPIYAKGRIKENAIISPLFDFIQLPVVYVLFKMGYPLIALAWVEFFAYVLLGVVIKPIIVNKIAEYNYGELMRMIGHCMIVTVLSAILPYMSTSFFDENTVMGFCIIGVISLLSVGAVVWFIGIDKSMKNMIKTWTKKMLFKNKDSIQGGS